MANQSNEQGADERDDDYYQDEQEPRTVPVFEIDGDFYQEFRKPASVEDWELSMMWRRHTVSSKAKDWGIVRAHQSRPIQSLYKRGRNFENIPAFKQYDVNEVQSVVERVQRPTKSAMLRSKDGETQAENKTNTSKSVKTVNIESQRVNIERLRKPTASQAFRQELTLKYRPKPLTPV